MLLYVLEKKFALCCNPLKDVANLVLSFVYLLLRLYIPDLSSMHYYVHNKAEYTGANRQMSFATTFSSFPLYCVHYNTKL